MKPLKEVCPEPKKVLQLEPEELGQHILHCLSSAKDATLKRATIARDMAAHYEESCRHDVAHAVEEALGWLFAQCMLGASPYDQDLVFLTRRGKKMASDYLPERPADI
jgi:hypothetical protein